MALTLTVAVTGTASEAEASAAKLIVDQENAKRAAQEPPGTPLPTTPANAMRTSYETVLAERMSQVHASYVQQAKARSLETSNVKSLWENATDAKRAAAVAALS